ncbi:MAG: hypothetical protein AMJ75_07305 [Phycisphaerae bacterium SM1_79]|nr:MAG: hypothetical protein AMJ75_07305 [Phycisphaerae bacterium SM1_79]
MDYTRRDFLKATLGTSTLLSFASTTPHFLVHSAMGAATRRDERDTVLVVVQLSGGNDGLNTLVPYGDDEYGRNRSTLRLPTEKLHKIDSMMGFHPRMGAFARLYKKGNLSVIQSVGYPNSDRSHEGAMRIWHTADPDRPNCQTGWIGSAADSVWNLKTTNTPAVFVGPITQPFALNAEKAVLPSIRSLDDLIIKRMPGDSQRQNSTFGESNHLLDFLRRSTLSAYTDSRRVEAAAKATANTAEYPSFHLADTFRTVAQLVRADVGIRIFFVEFGGGGIGGFDNHANQLGNHCALLHQLSESVAAFVNDLKLDKLLDRVLLMTFSEFGRTVKENGRRGTDHGAAAPVFLAGGKVKGGLIGARPSLTDLDSGAPKFHTDFRRLYAAVLDRWLGFESRTVLGRQFEPLDILSA